jgi:hypothetical protein
MIIAGRLGNFGDAVERRLHSGAGVGVGLQVEPDMGVADLNEGELVRRCGECLPDA